MDFYMSDLKEKVVLITGGAQGIGKGIAKKFAEQKSIVVISDIQEESAKKTAAEIGAEFSVPTLALVGDVSNQESVEKLFKSIVEKFQRIDILVNNAGITMDNLFIRMKPAVWQKVIDINLTGTYLCCYEAVKYMRKTRFGRIVNISSISANGNVGQANYSASKAGVEGLTKTLGKELAPFNIRVNAIAPGFIKTAMSDKIPDKIKERLIESISLARMGTPEEIANTVLFLTSEFSSYITAQVIAVNGGFRGA